MPETSEFEALANEIVSQVFPDQRKFWAANKRQLMDRIVASEGALPKEPHPDGDFKFIGELVLGIQIAGGTASFLASLLAIYATLRNMPSSDRSQQLDTLSKLLTQGNVAADDAAKIAKLFVSST
jgi:hypothetical protein